VKCARQDERKEYRPNKGRTEGRMKRRKERRKKEKHYMHIAFFWVVTIFSLLDANILKKPTASSFKVYFTMKTEVENSSETLVSIQTVFCPRRQ
jgi:hypothetical protein